MNSPEMIFKAITYLIDCGQKEAAFWAMGKLLSDVPGNGLLHNEMAGLAYELGDMQTALIHFKKAAELNPENACYLKNLADFQYVTQKDAESALILYEDVLKIDPSHIETLMTAGHICVSLRRYADARRHYQRAYDIDPDNSEAGHYIEKINHMQADGQCSNMSVDDLYAAAQAKVQEEDHNGAISLLLQALATEPSHAVSYNDLGVLYYKKGDLQAALTHYEKAVDLMPENEVFQKNLADFYWYEMKDQHRAMEAYVQALKLDPRDVEVLLNIAQICLAIGKTDDACDLIQCAIETQPWNENAQTLMAQLENRKQEIKDSGELYHSAKEKAANGDYSGAVSDLQKVVSWEPQNAAAYNDLGVLFYNQGDMENARASYEQAVYLDSEHPNYQKNLADFYLLEDQRVEDALKLYVNVLKSNPEDVESLIATGWACVGLNKIDDALDFFQRALEIEPWNEAARQALNRLEESEQTIGNGQGREYARSI
jgi:tetratricopeptide (TPR) repeat protein